jgi:hypothetical protein
LFDRFCDTVGFGKLVEDILQNVLCIGLTAHTPPDEVQQSSLLSLDSRFELSGPFLYVSS